MFPMKPEDAAMLVRRQHDELHEKLARERLAKAAQPGRSEVVVSAGHHVGVVHRLWAGAQHLVHPHSATHGTTHAA